MKVKANTDAFKQQIDQMIRKQWTTLPAFAFRKIITCKGVVLKGVSKAKDLQNGCNWNQDIGAITAPGFNKFRAFHAKQMQTMAVALSSTFYRAYCQTIKAMENSSANLVVIDKAKKKWRTVYPKMEAKLSVAMKKIDKIGKGLTD